MSRGDRLLLQLLHEEVLALKRGLERAGLHACTACGEWHRRERMTGPPAGLVCAERNCRSRLADSGAAGPSTASLAGENDHQESGAEPCKR